MAIFVGGNSLAQKSTPPTEAEVKAAIGYLEAAISKAELKGDRAALDAIYASDFSGINARGGSTVKNDIVKFYSGVPILAVNQTDDVKMVVLDTTVVVTARLKYQYNATQEDRTVKWMRYTRIYTLRKTKWLVVAEHFCFTAPPDQN